MSNLSCAIIIISAPRPACAFVAHTSEPRRRVYVTMLCVCVRVCVQKGDKISLIDQFVPDADEIDDTMGAKSDPFANHKPNIQMPQKAPKAAGPAGTPDDPYRSPQIPYLMHTHTKEWRLIFCTYLLTIDCMHRRVYKAPMTYPCTKLLLTQSTRQ
jgi:hypothetical protein